MIVLAFLTLWYLPALLFMIFIWSIMYKKITVGDLFFFSIIALFGWLVLPAVLLVFGLSKIADNSHKTIWEKKDRW